MRAEIVSVGTELLLGQTVNTNAQYLAGRLAAAGVEVYHQVTVGDNRPRLEEALRTALARADAVVVTGGLGPTSDDVTREAVAAVAGQPLVEDPDAVKALRAFFAARGRDLTPAARRQAQKPAQARLLPNRVGTAPGLWLELSGGKLVIALPGPPGEMRSMFEEHVWPVLAGRSGQVLVSRILRVGGLGESQVEERLGELWHSGNPTVAPYAQLAEVHLRLTSRAPSREVAEAALRDLEGKVRGQLGHHVYGVDDETLEAVCGRLLGDRSASVAVAESVTGGGVAARLARVPGASRYLCGGVVAYTQKAKETLLGVPAEVLEREGPVSAAVAVAMAEGVRRALSADMGLATTGAAGPEPHGKAPVGEVYVALASPAGSVYRRGLHFGSRGEIQERAAQQALWLLYEALVGQEGGSGAAGTHA